VAYGNYNLMASANTLMMAKAQVVINPIVYALVTFSDLIVEKFDYVRLKLWKLG